MEWKGLRKHFLGEGNVPYFDWGDDHILTGMMVQGNGIGGSIRPCM